MFCFWYLIYLTIWAASQMLLVVTVICRMVQIKKWALLSGEFTPRCPFRLWKCCREDLLHPLLDGSLYGADTALLAPCVWSLVRLSTWDLGGELKHRCLHI